MLDLSHVGKGEVVRRKHSHVEALVAAYINIRRAELDAIDRTHVFADATNVAYAAVTVYQSYP